MPWDGPDDAGAERVDVATSQTVSTLHINCNSVRSGGGDHRSPKITAGPGTARSPAKGHKKR